MSILCVMACAPPDPTTSVLLITVDTLRADHIGVYAAGPSVTPRIDELAAEGVTFLNAAAPMPMTRPSHFSIFTSLYPREHGVLNNAISLPADSLTLAELLQDAGYETAAFTGVSLLDEASGAAQGFGTFESPGVREIPAEQVVRRAMRWLERRDKSRPFFLWIHVFDPHFPYAPAPPFRNGLDPELDRKIPAMTWREVERATSERNGDLPRRIFEHGKGLYRGEVAYVDACVGRLLDHLRADQALADTLVVFTADHGESFEQGVYFEHSDSLLDGTIRVPLILSHPRHFHGGGRVETQASLLDVAPTVLAATGVAEPRSWKPVGRPLQGLGADEERWVLVQYPFYHPEGAVNRPKKHAALRSVAGEPVKEIVIANEIVGLVGRDWRLLRADDETELYALEADKSGGRDVPSTDADQSARLDALLTEALAEHPLRVIDAGEINPELLETLRALGYVE